MAKMVGARVETGTGGSRSGVKGGRSHGGDFLDDTMGMTDGDQAGGEKAQRADGEKEDLNDTTGFGGHNGAIATTPRGGTMVPEVEPEQLIAEMEP